MKVVKIIDVEAKESPSKIFTGGKVTVQSVFGESGADYRIWLIHFSPGARCVFHTHTFDQVVYVIEGKGIVATETEEVTVTPGTYVFFPANELHWHGATKDSAFSHIAIMPPGETSF